MTPRPSRKPSARAKKGLHRPTAAQVETLTEAIDTMLGIQARKLAITDPELLPLLRIAHLRRQAARSHQASAAPRPHS